MDDRLPPDPLIGELVELPRRERDSGRRGNGTFTDGGGGGREPTFMDEQLRRRILAYVQAGMMWRIAARACGIPASTAREWARRAKAGDEPYATFIDEVREYEAIGEAQLVASVAVAARRDPNLALKMLRIRFRERWAEDRIEAEDEDDVVVDEPLTTVEHLSEVVAALEEAGQSPMSESG